MSAPNTGGHFAPESNAGGYIASPQRPSQGRVVHFHEDGGPYPAIITAVNPDGTVELATFGRNSLYFQHNVSAGGPRYDTPSKGCWTWPPRT